MMKLKRYSKRFTSASIVVALASGLGCLTAFSYLSQGQEIIMSLLSVALAVLGGIGIFRYFKRKIITPWMFYVWLLPQIMIFTTNTYDHVNNTVSADLVYGTFLLPNISFNLAWELQQSTYLVANFHLLAIPAIVVLASILSHLKEDDEITEQVAAGNDR